MGDMLLAVVNYLQHEGIVAGDSIDTYRDFTPDKPDKAVILQEYPGLGTFRGAKGAHRRFQVIVRSSAEDPEWSKIKAWEVFNALNKPERVVVDERGWGLNLWGVLEPIQVPSKLKVDYNNRVHYVFNMNIITDRD